MRVAPLIHTRTFNCDFNSEFLIRPDIFMDADIKWARKIVLGATAAIDGLQGIRWVIADNGKYRIAGVVGFLKTIYSKCNLSKELQQKSNELFCDEKGRLVYAFIGVVIDKKRNESTGNISCEYLWNMYINMVYPVWKRTYQEVITREFENVDFAKPIDSDLIESVVVGTRELYESNDVFDYQLFLQLLNDRQKRDFTFCTNQRDFNVVKNSDFTILTTSHNNITRIKRSSITQPIEENNSFNPSFEHSVKTVQCESINKKKRLSSATICLLTLIVIILMFISLWVKSK